MVKHRISHDQFSQLAVKLVYYLLVWLQIMVKHRIGHDQFSQLAVKLVKAAPPCMSSGDDWEPTLAPLEELNLSLEHDNPAALTPLPDASGEWSILHACFEEYA